MEISKLSENLKLAKYVEILLKWNSSINLIGKSTESEIWKRHIQDLALLAPHINTNTNTLIDFGTGAGLPGLVLSILFPSISIKLIESDRKKCAFLSEAVRVLELANVEVINKRIEDIPPFESDIITSRAMASLTKLLEYSKPFSNTQSLYLFPKGESAMKEIEEAKVSWIFDCEALSLQSEGRLLKISNVRPRLENGSD